MNAKDKEGGEDLENFVLKAKKVEYAKAGNQTIVRVNLKAYNALVDMVNESGLSIKDVASQAIMYAQKHLRYEREEKL